MAAKRVLVLAAAVAAVWGLLAAAAWGAGPLFLVRPPITRRASGFYEFSGGGCAHALAQGAWTDGFHSVSCANDTSPEYATCGDTPQRHWRFGGEAQRCGARRLAAADARSLLAGQRLVFAGDSIARNLYGATLRLLGQPGQDIVVGHADFQHKLEGGISLQFFWAPYPQNLTGVLGQLAAGAALSAERRPQEQQAQPEAAGDELVAAGGGREQPELAAADVATDVQADVAAGGKLPTEAEEGPEQQQPQEVAGRAEAAGGAVEQQADAQQVAEQRLPGGEGGAARRKSRRRLQADEPDQGGQQQAEQQPRQQQPQQPSLVVLSTTLWHLLHFTEASDFEAQLGRLSVAAEGLAPAAAGQGGSVGGGAPRLVLASGTETFPNKMKTAEKQRNMTPANLDAYNRAMEQSGLLAPAGPCSLLDLGPLTRSCGEECSTDGVHSLPAVYDAALQQLLNIAAAGGQAAPQRPARRALQRASRQRRAG